MKMSPTRNVKEFSLVKGNICDNRNPFIGKINKSLESGTRCDGSVNFLVSFHEPFYIFEGRVVASKERMTTDLAQ
jgi:hypothetical protein